MGEFLELQNRKRMLLRDILDITNQQNIEINNENFEALDELIQSKQLLMNETEIVNRMLLSSAKDDKTKLNINSQSIDLLKKIDALDIINRKLLKEKMDDVLLHMSSIKTGKKGYNAYKGYGNVGSFYFDTKK